MIVLTQVVTASNKRKYFVSNWTVDDSFNLFASTIFFESRKHILYHSSSCCYYLHLTGSKPLAKDDFLTAGTIIIDDVPSMKSHKSIWVVLLRSHRHRNIGLREYTRIF